MDKPNCPVCGRGVTFMTRRLNAPTLYEPCGHQSPVLMRVDPISRVREIAARHIPS